MTAPMGNGWDSHIHSEDVKNQLLPTFDRGLSSLLVDLGERGMLDETLVVALGEMGRTPQPHRELGPQSLEYLVPRRAGRRRHSPRRAVWRERQECRIRLTRPTGPEDLAATIYDSLGSTLICDCRMLKVDRCRSMKAGRCCGNCCRKRHPEFANSGVVVHHLSNPELARSWRYCSATGGIAPAWPTTRAPTRFAKRAFSSSG